MIPALHAGASYDTASYTTALSSLPASSLPSLTASGAASPAMRGSRKGSLSPPVSRKASAVAAAGRGGGGARGAGGRAAKLPRGDKAASLPGDGSGGPRPASGPYDDHSDAGGAERSAASWSHPAGVPARVGAAAQRGRTASAARLSMYQAMNAGLALSGKPAAAAQPKPPPGRAVPAGASKGSRR